MALFSKENQPPKERKSRKGIPNTRTLIEKMLDQKTETDGRGKRISVKQRMVLEQVRKAIKGDSIAFSKVMDRLDGKPTQSVDLTTESKTVNITRPPTETEGNTES